VSDSNASLPSPEPPPPEGIFAIGPYAKRRRAEDHGLVILSMRLSYELVKGPVGYYLWVDESQAEAIYEQLQKYQLECKRWPPRQFAVLPGDYPTAPLALVTYAAILIGFFVAQSRWPDRMEALGGMDNGLGLVGAWERPLTALTLHADIGHLMSNLVSGLCFGYLINRTIGAGLGWCLVLASGYLGNVANAWFYWPEIHRSIGASTAIFGALGVLVGHAIAAKLTPDGSIKLTQRAAPLIAGIVMLLLTGFGTGNVDVMAHVFGFAAGAPLGAMGFAWARGFPRLPTSRVLLAAPLVLIAVAWSVAVYR